MSARSIAIAALVIVPALAAAQATDAGLSLATGFVPDPWEVTGHASGARSLADLAGGTCTGFVGDRPSQLVTLDTRFGLLRIFATSDADLVLGVHSIDRSGHSRWLCNDDRFGNAPMVEDELPRGQLEVWVGTHSLGASADYVLRFTESRSVRPGVGTGGTADDRGAATDLGLATTGAARFSSTHVHRGFLPDPHWLLGEARLTSATVDAGAESGPIEVTLLGNGCGGMVDPAPAHVLTLLDDFDFLQLYLCEPGDDHARCVPTTEPLSLVVLGPDGSFRCESASSAYTALAAGAEDGGWPAGDYRIWVGVHHATTQQSYRLGISELRRVR